MAARTGLGAALTLGVGLLAGCGGNYADRQTPAEQIAQEDYPPLNEQERRVRELGTVFDGLGGGGQVGNLVFGGGPRGDGLVGSVNRHLWAASLETLSFLPLASTDPYTGVIATDWGATPDAPGERFKVTAYVSDVALDPGALRVAVFRERRDDSGAWTPAPVAAETPRRIEDAILTRARQLRIDEQSAG